MGKRQPLTISEQLRQIIDNWPVSRYRIAQETGISQSLLSKLITGTRGISLETLDVLGTYLDLELRVRESRKSKST